MKILLFTDIHWGKHSNSDEYNSQCIDFLKFMKNWTKENLKEDFISIFLGDWYDSRFNLNIKTLHYGVKGLEILSTIAKKNYVILGNHDLYYKNSRKISSMFTPKDAGNIEIINKATKIDNMLLLPWLNEEENASEIIRDNAPDYVFGHLELPTFNFNRKIKKSGEFNPEDYRYPKRILLGHFHSRQERNNITYIGNCFSHDFSDENDWHNKGFAILDTNTNDLKYIEWKDAPKYIITNLSQLDNIDFNTPPNTLTIQLKNDLNLTPCKISSIQKELKTIPSIKDITFAPEGFDVESDSSISIENIEDVNTLICSLLKNIDSKQVNAEKLVETYIKLGD